MSRSAARPLPSLDAARAAALEAKLAPWVGSRAVWRRLAGHAILGASVLLVIGWPLVALWLALAFAATLAASSAGRRRIMRRAHRPSPLDRLLPAASAYAAPALLALLAATIGGGWGLAAAAFMLTALAVHAVGQGDVAACLRWLRRRRARRAALPAAARIARSAAPTRITPAGRAAPAASPDSGQAMRTLLADLLDLSRLEAGRLTVGAAAFDLRSLLAATVRDWRPEARRKGLAFGLTGGAQAPRWVVGDPVRIRQILDTLMANALKFTTAGSVTLTVGAEPRADGRIDLTLAVLDSGPGMTSDQFAALFNAYDRREPAARRAGPGLSRHLARALARLMGGELTASSAPGLGAAFSLKLPLALADGGEGEIDTARGLRVLVVDDHAVYRQAFSLILATVCREVVCAQDGIEALDLLAAEPFDLVLLDLAMPRLGGLPATRRLRASSSLGRDVAVIALTASDSEDDRAACLAAGMNGFVSKPVDARELLAAIHAVISGEAIPQAA
ncbi:response regulator [Phenylobacterium terrae]|uniref:histidine kinase n=1 Tax=Phenylobacterium terrae TaxID=2665495 RepID=A0ABW4N5E8_9CAUL